MAENKIVFISYSWDNQIHQDWVLNLANQLVRNGIDVILDQYELSAGKEMTLFMEKASTADKILLILTPNYKLKADKREGGVGFEYSIISRELYENKTIEPKIIPILRLGDVVSSSPLFIKGLMNHEMLSDALFDSKLFELIKIICDKPLITKPVLGKLPDFEQRTDQDIEKMLTDYNVREKKDREKYAIINNRTGVDLFNSEVAKIFNSIGEGIKYYSEKFNFNFPSTRVNGIKGTYLLSTINFTYYFAPNLSSSNMAGGSFITMDFYRGPKGIDDSIHIQTYDGPSAEIYKRKYLFDLDDEMNPIWINEKDKYDLLKTNDVPNLIFRHLVTNELDLKSKS